MLSLAQARPLLKNPDRGLRMESYITLGNPLQSYPGSAEDPYEKLRGFIAKYEEESPQLLQLYVYLTQYNKKALDALAFSQLQSMLELCREQGLRVLLRFTYQNEDNPDAAWPQVKQHLEQIGAWFEQHRQLIDDTLSVMQGGIIGMWGEGHNNKNFESKYTGAAFDLLCSITPEDIYVQLRNIDLMESVSAQHRHRIGIHDDYMIGEQHGRWNFFLGKNSPAEHRAAAGFCRTLNDGEMPWGHATYYDEPDGRALDAMEAMPILQQLKQYGLSSLSLEHNYRETSERVFSMQRWREEYITQAQLNEAKLPYHPSLLDADGRITVFHYIQYHLGYLLSVTACEYDESQLSITLANNGFAAPLNFNALSIEISGEEYDIESYDKYALGSMQKVTYALDLPPNFNASQRIEVKLARRAGSSLCARFMNAADIFAAPVA